MFTKNLLHPLIIHADIKGFLLSVFVLKIYDLLIKDL